MINPTEAFQLSALRRNAFPIFSSSDKESRSGYLMNKTARGFTHSIRTITAAVVTAAALVLASAVSASAAPAPDNGPVAGGTTVTLPTPGTQVTLTQVAVGAYHNVAIGSDGNAYTWGHNSYGQLGIGTTTRSPNPVQVLAPAGVTFTQTAAGLTHSVAIGSDGNVYTWGDNSDGQLGDGTNTSLSLPFQVPTPAGVTFTHITAGEYFSMATGSDGNTYAWGDNFYGQLGDGTTTNSSTPVQVLAPAGVTFTQIKAGGFHVVAIGSDGNTYAWGDNGDGQLGDGTTTNSSTPVETLTPAGVTFTQIQSGSYHVFAVGSDGNNYAWGANTYGQLGDGTTTSRSTPAQLLAPAGVTFTQVTGGFRHSLAIGSDGNTYAWGNNGNGRLGDGTTTDSSIPVQVLAPAGVTFTKLTAGRTHSVGIGSDGNTYAWGFNQLGQLGNGTTTNSSIPVQVTPFPSPVVVRVTFGGVAGTSLVNNGDGTLSVVTPPHPAGPVDVVVEWTLNGVPQTSITYPGGFTYVETVVALTITDPANATVNDGNLATFTVTTTGTNVTVTWEVSSDNGATWQRVATGVSPDGRTLQVTGSSTVNGNKYRATAANTSGTAMSAAALLTVTQALVPGGGTTDARNNAETKLASTGGALTGVTFGIAALLLAAGVMLAVRRRAGSALDA